MSYLMELYKRERTSHKKLSKLQTEFKLALKKLKDIELTKGDSRFDETFEYYQYLQNEILNENRKLTNLFLKIREIQVNERIFSAN
ncbi:Uncharacterised protein [Achromobacter xylosoxidans]|jgi:hypothetical protein|uniref:hypothetical protein n=1 Tax=Alcaligenes xylosoxydans xylosoxydans TaxID=85698 RepID=UPI0006C6CB5E|nr:hypothetical protein [Achromobacter xylosoxidans]CUJ92282.1 Uncharacterised protein [Achromobacter xylosoxidans]